MQIIWLSVWVVRLGVPSDPSHWAFRLMPDRTGASLHFNAAAAKGRWNTIEEAAAARVMSVFPTEAAVEIEIRCASRRKLIIYIPLYYTIKAAAMSNILFKKNYPIILYHVLNAFVKNFVQINENLFKSREKSYEFSRFLLQNRNYFKSCG